MKLINSVQFDCQLVDKILETDTQILISVQAVHKPLQLALCDVEPILSQHVPQIILKNDPSLLARKVLKNVPKVETGSASQTHSQSLDAPFRLEHEIPKGHHFLPRVKVEELSQVGEPSTVKVGPIGDQPCILSAEGQDKSIEVLVGEVAHILFIKASKQHVNVVTVERTKV